MAKWKNSHPLHSPLHLFILLSVLEKPHKWLFPFFSSFTHSAPGAFDTLMTCSLLCYLPFYPLQVLGYSWTSLQPAPVQHISAPAAYFHFMQSLRHCPCHLQPNNIIAFPPYTRHVLWLQGCRQYGIILVLVLWSWEWCPDTNIAFSYYLLHVQE